MFVARHRIARVRSRSDTCSPLNEDDISELRALSSYPQQLDASVTAS
jgi:hypothetical protein